MSESVEYLSESIYNAKSMSRDTKTHSDDVTRSKVHHKYLIGSSRKLDHSSNDTEKVWDVTSLGLESHFHFRLNNFLDECCATSVKRCSLEFDTGSSNEQFSCKTIS